MNTQYEVRYAVGQREVKAYDTSDLRREFLVERCMQADKICWVYSHYERFMVGGAVPISTVLTLDTIEPLKSPQFLARRELGIINVGGAGQVKVGDTTFLLEREEALYVGQTTDAVSFSSMDAKNPARFYLNSTPAHHAFPHTKIGKSDAKVLHMGTQESANVRDINQLMINSVVKTCQLQMGLTRLHSGSVWNTMPAHQHDRRNEVYFYFDIPEHQAVCHFMGEPHETRHIWVKNENAVISPPWSIHSGVGTASYAFIWGMAGENLDYDDMDKYQPDQLL
jgi:4-deoxy-L-threo-5-hexosulose-uronate ketol-isomerase